MSYEYLPKTLQAWIVEYNRTNGGAANAKPLDFSKYQNTMEQLKKQFIPIIELGNVETFQQWTATLNRREKGLMPFLFENEMAEEWTMVLAETVRSHIDLNRRSFRLMLEAFYQIGCKDPMWQLVQYAYKNHLIRLERRLNESSRIRWRDYINETNPFTYLGELLVETAEGSFNDRIAEYSVSEHHSFYRKVFLETIKQAKVSFFLREESIYRSIFHQATSHEQQQMAHNLIRNCQLDQVVDLADMLYDSMGTYRLKPILWEHVGQEEKEKFARWILRKTLREFFKDVDTNHERYKYWEKYIGKLNDAVVLDKNTTLLMYFQDVVIMEVLGTGAVYVYNNATFEKHYQQIINQLLARREQVKNKPWLHINDVKRSELMNKDLIVDGGWLRHFEGWQQNFDYWLRNNLGWEVNRHVLLQKETE